MSRPWTSLQNPTVPVMRCVTDIVEHYDFLLHNKIQNETEVRFIFGNMIVEMLCRYFQFKLSLEQSDYGDDASLNISSGSRYDYVMWSLMYTGRTQLDAIDSDPKGVPLIVIETKHQDDLSLATAGQAISYFSRAKRGITNYSGVGLLLNEWNGTVQFRILLFPYTKPSVTVFGIQAILLPTIALNYDEFIKGDVIKLISTICGQFLSTQSFRMDLPDELEIVAPDNMFGAYTKDELQKQQLKQKDEIIAQLQNKIKQLQN